MVEYAANKPEIARILGMRTKPFGPEVLFVIIFPLIGLGLISLGLANGARTDYLLRHGIPTLARLVSKDSTGLAANRQMVYKYTFGFSTAAGAYCTASANSTGPRFENGVQERILYDPSQPERAVLLDSLPGAAQMSDGGRILGTTSAPDFLCLILPGLTIVGHGCWAIWWLCH